MAKITRNNNTVSKPDCSCKTSNNNGKPAFRPAFGRIRLNDSSDIRRLVNSIINDLRQYKVDHQTARAIMYGAQILLQTIETQLIEKDIRELQQIAQDKFGYTGECVK
jgi:hypothetical protein